MVGRPLEKGRFLSPELEREMRQAYPAQETLARALGVTVVRARQILRGEGMRDAEYERIMDAWITVDPSGVRDILRVLVEHGCLSQIETDDLVAFFNALFPDHAV